MQTNIFFKHFTVIHHPRSIVHRSKQTLIQHVLNPVVKVFFHRFLRVMFHIYHS